MSFALQPTSLIPVKVNLDWSTEANVYTDITTALEESFPGVFAFPSTDSLNLALVQIQSSYTDKSSVSLNTDGTATVSTAFSATPEVGSVAYIIDMY